MPNDLEDLKSLRYSICISGAAAGQTVKMSRGLAEELGVAIAKAGHIITTGATIGLPYFAAYSAKQNNGTSIGFSRPAACANISANTACRMTSSTLSTSRA